MKTKFLFFLLVALFCFPSGAKAVIGNIDTLPTQRSVSLNSGASFTMTWRIQTNAAAPFTLQSAVGEFRRDGNSQVAWATTRTLSRRFKSATGTILFSETVSVPQSVMRRALKENNGRFTYFRSWTDDGFIGVNVQDIDLVVTAGMGGALSLSQATLTFDNGTSFRTISKNEDMTAKARVAVNGTGKFSAVWEVGRGGDSSFFYPIKTVSRTLAGQRFLDLESSLLPTKNTGRYEIRLRITEPGNALDIPTLSYFVTDGDRGQAGLPRIEVSEPAMNASAGRDTAFKWQPWKAAVAYRLQILDKSTGAPVTSMLVKGNEAVLSAFVLGQLQSPAAYMWRVLAIDPKGNVIGASEPRNFRTRS